MATRTQGRGGAAAAKKAAASPQPQGAKGSPAAPERKQPFADEEAAERAKLNDVTKKIEDCRARVTTIRAQLAEKDKVRAALMENKKKIQLALRQVGDERHKVIAAKKAMDGQIQQAIANIKSKTADIEKYKDRLPFKNEKSEDFAAKNQAFIDKEIKKFEDQLNSTSMSLSDEKKVIAELNQWKQLKNAVRDFDVKEEVNKLNALRTEVKTFHSKLDSFTAKEDAILKTLEEAHNKVNESALASQALIKQMNAEFSKIDDLQEKRAKIDKEVNVWRQKRAEENQKLRKQYEEDREKRQKQYEEDKLRRQQDFLDKERKRQEDREAVEVLKVPYEEELGLCDNLIGYLTELAPAAKKRNPKSELKIQWEVYLSFEHLSLIPPRTPSEIDGSLTDLKAKKEHFQRLSTEKIEQRKLAKAQKAEEKKVEETPAAEKPKEEPAEEKKVEPVVETSQEKGEEEAQ